MVKLMFKRDILIQKQPGNADIDKVLNRKCCLEGRSWRNVKDFIRNRYFRSARKRRCQAELVFDTLSNILKLFIFY